MVTFRTPRLAINVNSWHFRHYANLRRLWGWSEPPERTSLCPYVQTTIWLSVLLVVTSPVILLGWLWTKGIVAIEDWFRSKDDPRAWAIADWIQETGPYRLAKSVNGEVNSDKALAFFASGCMLLAMVGAFSLGGFIIGGAAIKGQPYLWNVAASPVYAGWGIIKGSIFVGASLTIISWMLGTTCKAVCRFLTDPHLWRTIGTIALWLSGASVASVAITLLGVKITHSAGWQRFAQMWCQPAVPGSYRRVVITQAIEKEKVGWPRLSRAWRGIKGFFISSTVNLGSGTVKVMSPMAVIFAFLWAIKKQACPLVEFVDARHVDPKKR